MKFDDIAYSYSKHLDILDSMANKLNAMKATCFQKSPKNSNSSDEDDDFYLF